MRFTHLFPALAIGVAGAAQSGSAQMPGVFLAGQRSGAVIGIMTSSAATSRDTLGVLVSSVHSGSPAEKAGIEEGNRIASINGVSLRLAAADVGDEDMANIMTRRLSRELEKIKPGDDVDLRVYANGQTKSLKIKTIAAEDLYEADVRRRDAERPTLGLNIGATGTSRDSLGVFVMGVVDGGPAAKAGVQEGSRIVSINGVDVRGQSDDDELVFRASNVNRFEREVSRLKPGDDVELRVLFAGQSRTVKFKAGRLSDLPQRRHVMTIIRGDEAPGVKMLDIDGARIGDQVRRAIDGAGFATGSALSGVGRAFKGFGNQLSW